jgi:hypothetical protein
MNTINIFLSPRRYFTNLKEKREWLLPLFIVLISALLVSFVSRKFLTFEEIAERMRERGLGEEQIDRVKSFYHSPMSLIVSSFSVIFTTVIFILLFSLILNLSLPLFGQEGNFGLTFSLVANSFLISALGNIIRIILMFLKRSPSVVTNLSLLLPATLKKTLLFSFFSHLDIFLIWQIALLGFGLNLTYELKGKQGYYLVFGFYLLWVIFATLFFRARG